jgi:UDP-glucuronate decarboxylase
MESPILILNDPIRTEDWMNLTKRLDLSPLAGRTFLITGASGLIGRYVAGTIASANQHQGLGCRVVCVSRQPQAAMTGVEWVSVDLSGPIPLTQPFDYIFHGACYAQPSLWFSNRPSLIDLNITATRHLLELSRQAGGAFLFCSSGEAYGDPPPHLTPIPETYVGGPDPTAKRAIYGQSKRMGEVLCSVYREDYGVRAYAARISHLYGPGIGLDDQRVFADFMRQALAGQPIRLRDQGLAVKTLGYIADAVEMIFNIMLKGQQTIYNVGGADHITIHGLAQQIADLAGGVPVILPEQTDVAPHIGTDAGVTKLDLSRYTCEFGPPAFTDLTTGLKRMIDWNRSVSAGKTADRSL